MCCASARPRCCKASPCWRAGAEAAAAHRISCFCSSVKPPGGRALARWRFILRGEPTGFKHAAARRAWESGEGCGDLCARRTCVGCARAWRALQAARPVTRARYRAVPPCLGVQLSAARVELRHARAPAHSIRAVHVPLAFLRTPQPARCCTKRCWPSWAAPATFSWTRRRSARPAPPPAPVAQRSRPKTHDADAPARAQPRGSCGRRGGGGRPAGRAAHRGGC